MMCRRSFVLLLLALPLLASDFWGSNVRADDSAQAPPNILFIMSDDHTSQAVGAYQRRLAKLNPTPTIDELAKQGMLFENAFCSNSICTPSRACVISGRYSHITNTRDLDDTLAPEFHTLPRQLRNAGYQTAVIGKWHLTNEPTDFDYYCVLPGQGKYFDPFFQVRGEKPWPDRLMQVKGKHSSDAITDLTLDWFKNQRDAFSSLGKGRRRYIPGENKHDK